MSPRDARTIELDNRTVQDFGEQWTHYQDNSGYYGSLALFEDVFGPLREHLPLSGARVADVGAGTGRFVPLLLAAGATHVTALEPSAAFAVLLTNTAAVRDRLTCLNLPGQALPPTGDLDIVFSIGVLHHIADPGPVVRAALGALRPGGKLAVWLYGREGNRTYVLSVQLLRAISRHLSHRTLALVSRLLYLPAALYMQLCLRIDLPLAGYMREVFWRFSPDKRRLVIYDQLNPACAKYYTAGEARALLEQAGFIDVRLYHRHGYSWSVVGTRPIGDRVEAP